MSDRIPANRIPRTVEALLARTISRPDSDCREWIGAKTDGGYGKLGSTTVHRVMYELAVGPIPDDYTIVATSTICNLSPDG